MSQEEVSPSGSGNSYSAKKTDTFDSWLLASSVDKRRGKAVAVMAKKGGLYPDCEED